MLRSQTSSLSTPDAHTMGVTSVLCQLDLVWFVVLEVFFVCSIFSTNINFGGCCTLGSFNNDQHTFPHIEMITIN